MSRWLPHTLVVVIMLVLVGGVLPTHAYTDRWKNGNAGTRAATVAYGNLPLMFIENRGQMAEAVRYYLPGSDRTVYLTDDAIWVTLHPSVQDGKCSGMTLKLSFPGANPHLTMQPLKRLATSVNYFLGNDPAKWHTNVPVYAGVRYVDLYPGIDLEISDENGRWVQRLVAREGADLSAVRLRMEGAEGVELAEGGMLRVRTTQGDFRLPLLTLETADGTSLPSVLTRPLVRAVARVGAAFEISHPFASAALPFDTIAAQGTSDLLYATFLGGNSSELAYDIAVDTSGSVYLVGSTQSSGFPTGPGYDTDHNGGTDAFVVKLNPDGSNLVYATFLGGSGRDEGRGIAVDGSGNAYVTGYTNSSNFPTTSGSYDTSYNGGYEMGDVFLVKLNVNGSTLEYATFLGGSSDDLSYSITVDASSEAYVTGYTSSSNFPTIPGSYDDTHNGDWDVFVVKLNPGGSNLVYATFLGGSDRDEGHGIAVDGSGNAYVTGHTSSSNFPTTSGSYDTSYSHAQYDAFVAKLNPSGNSLVYSTFLGNYGWTEGRDIAVDSNGNAYITGYYAGSNYPTTPGSYDPSYNGDGDAFVTKLNASGSGLMYSTFLGGSGMDGGHSITVDSSGNAYVTGETESSNFPTISGSYDTSHNGGADVFVVKLNASGNGLMYATFIGGGGQDRGNGIAVDSGGNAYVTGSTTSSNFPAGPGHDPSYNGSEDAFVVKLATGGGTTPPGPKPWLFLLYLAGDNNLYPDLQRAVQQLEAQSANPYVNVLVLFDGNRTNDTWRFVVQPLGNYTIGVNKWHLGELNMGDPQTLVNFITWAREQLPAQYYYLAIANHGRGTTGIAWDETNYGDYLTTAELRTALSTATNSGQWKIHVMHYDTCLMALLENAYQVKDYVDYLVASQNLAWSVFAYQSYARVQGAEEMPPLYEFADLAAQVSASTTPRQLATGVVETYFNHPGVQGYPRTISALDLSRVSSVRQAVDTFATALRNNLNDIKSYIQNARNATQKFDSRDYYRITNDDEYMDLYHFAQRVKQYVSVGDVQTAAQEVINAIDDGFVVAERHQSGLWEGEEALYWDLDNAHGVSIYFPPRSGSSDYDQYVNHQLFRFTAEGQWDEFLVDYFGVMGLPPETPTAPGLPPMLAPDYKEVYLPIIMRSR